MKAVSPRFITYVDQKTKEEAQKKAHKKGFSLSYAIRELLRMWVAGEVDIAPPRL